MAKGSFGGWKNPRRCRATYSALSQADSVVVEVILTPDVAYRMVQVMLLTDGRNLTDIVGAERFARITAVAGRYRLQGAQINRFRPWALMTMFSVPPAEASRQGAGHPALDQVIQSTAQENGAALFGLETPEEQFAIFADLSEAEQVAFLDAAVNLNPEIEEIFERLKSAYLAGDLDTLYRLSKERTGGVDPKLMDTFLTRAIDVRNERMVDRMGERLSAGNAFVAVGALHLPGERGILRLLELKGYRISRVH
jgi:uncharacterized protein YbaP (TraB family)